MSPLSVYTVYCHTLKLTDSVCIGSDTKLTELELPEGPVLELLNAVSIAKRMANMVCLWLDSLGVARLLN